MKLIFDGFTIMKDARFIMDGYTLEQIQYIRDNIYDNFYKPSTIPVKDFPGFPDLSLPVVSTLKDPKEEDSIILFLLPIPSTDNKFSVKALLKALIEYLGEIKAYLIDSLHIMTEEDFTQLLSSLTQIEANKPSSDIFPQSDKDLQTEVTQAHSLGRYILTPKKRSSIELYKEPFLIQKAIRESYKQKLLLVSKNNLDMESFVKNPGADLDEFLDINLVDEIDKKLDSKIDELRKQCKIRYKKNLPKHLLCSVIDHTSTLTVLANLYVVILDQWLHNTLRKDFVNYHNIIFNSICENKSTKNLEALNSEIEVKLQKEIEIHVAELLNDTEFDEIPLMLASFMNNEQTMSCVREKMKAVLMRHIDLIEPGYFTPYLLLTFFKRDRFEIAKLLASKIVTTSQLTRILNILEGEAPAFICSHLSKMIRPIDLYTKGILSKYDLLEKFLPQITIEQINSVYDSYNLDLIELFEEMCIYEIFKDNPLSQKKDMATQLLKMMTKRYSQIDRNAREGFITESLFLEELESFIALLNWQLPNIDNKEWVDLCKEAIGPQISEVSVAFLDKVEKIPATRFLGLNNSDSEENSISRSRSSFFAQGDESDGEDKTNSPIQSLGSKP